MWQRLAFGARSAAWARAAAARSLSASQRAKGGWSSVAWPGLGVGVAGSAAFYATAPIHAETRPEVAIPDGRQRWVATPLLGKVAVVTGSSQGIGAGIALEIAHAGADICVNYVGDAGPANDLAKKIRAIGRECILVEADVSNRDQIEKMFDRTEKELGPVQVLVTNAITSKRSNILETKIEDFEQTMQIGVFGVFHCMQVFSQRAVAAGLRGGSIVHIGSPHAHGPFKDALDYNVAKAGSDHLARSAANELMWAGIRVNIVQPGWTYTEGELRLYSQEVLDRSAKMMPLGRLCMPADIGKAVVWLCSDEAAYVTGASLTVDGGQFIETAPSWHSSGRHQ